VATDNERQEALGQIAEIARQHRLTARDIATFMVEGREASQRRSEILTRLFAYLGGIFVFAGLCIYTGMQWSSLNPYARIVITLGTGLVAYVLGVLCLRDQRYQRAATPLLLIAGLFQPAGMMVTINEFSSGGDPRLAFLWVFGIMAVQMALTFWREQRGVLLFLLLLYGSSWLGVAFDWLEAEGEWTALLVGFFMLAMSWAISRTRFHAVAGIWYFLGSALFLAGSWTVLDDWNLLELFVALAAFFVYLSVAARSRALLLNAVLALLAFIGYYTAEYFADSTVWPLGLLIMGAVLVAMSRFALGINRRYLK
jgi:hypothetical protein